MFDSFRASDGILLPFRRWTPAGRSPRAIIVGLHGVQSHSGWYVQSSRWLAEAGFEVLFLDRRGSGLSTARRGHALHAERLVNDVVQFVRAVRIDRRPTCPVVLMGVSWGGKLAAAVAARRAELFDAVAFLYPGLCPQVGPSWFQRAQLWLAQAVGWGLGRVPIPLTDPTLFTNNPSWQEFIRRDELSLHRATVDFLAVNLVLSRTVEQHVRRLNSPLLLMLAGRDQIIDNAATRALIAKAPSQRRTVLEYSDARHTLEFEPHPRQYVDDLIAWLDRLPNGAVAGGKQFMDRDPNSLAERNARVLHSP